MVLYPSLKKANGTIKLENGLVPPITILLEGRGGICNPGSFLLQIKNS